MAARPTAEHTFERGIAEPTLRSYLARAVTYNNALGTTSLEDDLRMLREIGALFLGRSAYVWRPTTNEEEHFRLAAAFAARVREEMPATICQAAIFEAVYPAVDAIPVPPWVFEEFGERPVSRTFRYAEMAGADFQELYRWNQFGIGGVVPDLTLRETQRYFYYRARRYLDAGYEAIHLGQPHLYAGKDRGFAVLADLLVRIRRHAAKVARRHWVLLDAHTHGIARKNHLLFDFHSRPLSARAWTARPEKIILQQKGRSLGGIAPSGWRCDALPYLIEVDNWGGYSVAKSQWENLEQRAAKGRWGWDDIAWLAHQPKCERDAFLLYAHRWMRVQDGAGYFQMPVRRTLGAAGVVRPDFNGTSNEIWHYQANYPSAACPDGFDQEATIRQAWDEAPPDWLPSWQHRHADLPPVSAFPHGQNIPEHVAILGELQVMLGGEPNQTWCAYSRMHHHGGGRFELATVIPYPGTFTFSIACGGTHTEVYRQNGLAGGSLWRLQTTAVAQRLRIRFDYATKLVQALDDRDASLLVAPPSDAPVRAPGMNGGLASSRPPFSDGTRFAAENRGAPSRSSA